METPDKSKIVIFRGILEAVDRPLKAHGVASEMLSSFANGLAMHSNWSDDDEFRSFLILARASLGLSQKELAYQLMVTPMTLQRWLKGQVLPLPRARKAVVAELLEIAHFMIDEIGSVPGSASTLFADEDRQVSTCSDARQLVVGRD